jgi:hypothetical protein
MNSKNVQGVSARRQNGYMSAKVDSKKEDEGLSQVMKVHK